MVVQAINRLHEFSVEQNVGLTEYDESLLMGWLGEITMLDDRFSVEQKSGIRVKIEG